MNRSSFILVAAVLFIVGLSSLNLSVMGQAVGPSVIMKCPDEAPGRPTLKRRQPTPDSTATNGTSDDQKPAVKEDCQPQNAATEVSEHDLVRREV